MSDRTIVALGVWLLLLVLIGTATIGMALVFYMTIGLIAATLAAGLFLMGRRRQALRTEGFDADTRA